MEIPGQVLFLYSVLKSNGYKSWIVGGCIRDYFLGKTPKDWDMCSDAPSHVLKEIYEQNGIGFDPLGYEFGTVVAVFENGEKTEVQSISGKTIEENLKSRDFTVNAMAFDIENKKIIDLFGGIEHTEKRLLKTVDCADSYFIQNPFAILRAVRLSAELDFCIEEETYNAMKRHFGLIETVPSSRISREIGKIINFGICDRVVSEKTGETK